MMLWNENLQSKLIRTARKWPRSPGKSINHSIWLKTDSHVLKVTQQESSGKNPTATWQDGSSLKASPQTCNSTLLLPHYTVSQTSVLGTIKLFTSSSSSRSPSSSSSSSSSSSESFKSWLSRSLFSPSSFLLLGCGGDVTSPGSVFMLLISAKRGGSAVVVTMAPAAVHSKPFPCGSRPYPTSWRGLSPCAPGSPAGRPLCFWFGSTPAWWSAARPLSLQRKWPERKQQTRASEKVEYYHIIK